MENVPVKDIQQAGLCSTWGGEEGVHTVSPGAVSKIMFKCALDLDTMPTYV